MGSRYRNALLLVPIGVALLHGGLPPGAPATPGDPAPAVTGPGGAQREIERVLDRYRAASEARDLDAVAHLYGELSAVHREAIARYFENATDLRIAVRDVEMEVIADEAVVSFTRIDDFVDARTARPVHVATRVTKRLRRTGGVWRFAPGP